MYLQVQDCSCKYGYVHHCAPRLRRAKVRGMAVALTDMDTIALPVRDRRAGRAVIALVHSIRGTDYLRETACFYQKKVQIGVDKLNCSRLLRPIIQSKEERVWIF